MSARAAIAFAVLFVASTAAADDAGAPADAPDAWEKGRGALPAPRPRGAALRACSFAKPICVHGAAGSESAALDTLHAFERAFDAPRALALPRPDVDATTGALDVYLVDGVDDDVRVRFAARDPLASYDRASAFVEVPRALSSCERETAAHRAVFEAMILRVAPSTSEAVALATSSHLAALSVACATALVHDVATFQARPTSAIVDAHAFESDVLARRYSRGARAFFDWADMRFGTEVAGLVRATFSVAPTRTPFPSERFESQPDLFEVWRKSFKDRISVNSTLDDLFFRFAITRPSLGAHTGANVKADLAVDWPARPRRFLSAVPVSPTGASYVSIRRAGAPPGSRLRVEAEWEEHAQLRWAVIKLDAKGDVIGNVLVPSTSRATSAQATIAELDNVDSVLVVAMNVGDRDRKFDPDDGAWEPHAYLLTVASE